MPSRTSALPGLSVALLLGAAPAAVLAQPAPPPNVVVIVFDDLGAGDLEPYGGTFIETPNAVRLAEEGMRFSRFYSTASSCSPARAGLLTGRHPASLGIRRNIKAASQRALPVEFETLGEALRGHGYATGHFGKWHVGDAHPGAMPGGRGFDRSVLAIGAASFDPELLVDGTPTPVVGHLTDVTTDYVLDFIEQSGGSPFFAQVWYRTPHTPWEPPAVWADQYPDTPEGLYAAMVSHGDEQIGRILDALEAQNLAENTLVIAMSDHGPIPSALDSTAGLRGNKGDVYEGGIRIPLLARWPGRIEAGAVHAGVFTGTDLFPTLVELASGAAPFGVAGRSLVPALLWGAPAPERTLFWVSEHDHKLFIPEEEWFEHAVRSDRWKLVQRGSEDAELYDLEVDPAESDDRAAEHPVLVETLQRAYLEWRASVARVPLVRVAGPDVLARDWFEIGTQALQLDGDSRLRFGEGDFSFQVRICPTDVSGQRFLARQPGVWELSIDEGTVRAVVSAAQSTVYFSHATPVQAGQESEVALTLLGRKDRFSCMRLSVDGGPKVERCVRDVALSSESLEIGGASSGGAAFEGWIWRPEAHATALYSSELDDRDRDGIPNGVDDCTGHADGPTAGTLAQRDSDGDGVGDACDADYDGNGIVGGSDFAAFSYAWLGAYDPRMDHSGDGVVGGPDYVRFVTMYGAPPGPSALASSCGP